MHFSSLAVGTLLLGLVCALPAADQVSAPLDKRENCFAGTCDNISKRTSQPGCNADNLLRNLRDARYSVYASAFCSTYIQSTVTITSKVAATITEVVEVTPYPIKTTVTNFHTLPNTFVKRDGTGYPTWLPATYPPSRVSSACSCFVTPSPPVTKVTTITTGTDIVKTTKTAPTPVTTVVVKDSGYCNVPGCYSGQTLTVTVNSAFSAEQCVVECRNTPSCQSIQFGIEGGTSYYCNMFSVPIADVYATGTSTNSYCSKWTFYDVDCPVYSY